MTFFTRIAALLFGLFVAMTAAAQEPVWLQIEAQPNQTQAEDRARAYAGVLPDVAGFRLSSGWYAIVLGPYAADDAPARLRDLKRTGLIPNDAYVAEGNSFRDPFWPAEGAGVAVPPVATDPILDPAPAETVAEPVAETAAAPEPVAEPIAEAEPAAPALVDETPAEARRSEQALDRAGREGLQTALQWFGYYNAAIDGAFGPGTRKSMAAWQADNGFDSTGVLTSFQRDTLLAAYQLAQQELGLDTVTEEEAGIEITLPLAMVGFDHYEPPFVHFAPKDGSGVSVILISQPGDQATLYGLYDILQTLEIMPLEGTRDRRERSFTLSGRNDRIETHAFAELSRGLIKGYLLSYPVAETERMGRVLKAMQSSFRPVGDKAMDPGLVPMTDEARRGLLAGLEVRRPIRSRSGFFVDGSGAVLTTAEAVAGCGRITIERDYDATLVAENAAQGLALLKPAKALAPRTVAQLRLNAPRVGGEVAVAGYSYEDQLPSPALTFGRFEDGAGLNGEAGISRLALAALPGDAGGPVMDETGAVIGLLAGATGTDPARQLPPDVSFAVAAPVLADLLATAGISPATTDGAGALAPEDLTRLATGMTVLVSCWE